MKHKKHMMPELHKSMPKKTPGGHMMGDAEMTRMMKADSPVYKPPKAKKKKGK